MCCNPENGRVDIKEQLDYKTKFHVLEGNENLSADFEKCFPP